MRPVLYSAGAIDPSRFDNMGIGILADAVTCIVTEERNGDFTLSMTYPVVGRHFDDILPQNIIYAFPYADAATPQPFEITFVSRPFNGVISVEAIHAAQNRAAYIVVTKTYTTTASAIDGLTYLMEVCPGYTLSTFPLDFESDVTIGSAAKYGAIERPERLKDLLYGAEGSAIDVFGGEWSWDHDVCTLSAARGVTRAVTLTYGKNISDIVQEINLDGVTTTLYPYWHGNDSWVYANSGGLVESSHVSDFTYQRILAVDVTEMLGTDTTPTGQQVRDAGAKYIAANQIGVPDLSVSVKFVMRSQTSGYEWLKDLETIKLCDTVAVDYPPLGINLAAKVTKTEWDVLHDRYESVEIGTVVKPSLASAILRYVGRA